MFTVQENNLSHPLKSLEIAFSDQGVMNKSSIEVFLYMLGLQPCITLIAKEGGLH